MAGVHCEHRLDERFSEGLTQVVRVWDAADRLREEAFRAEREAAEASRAVQLAEALIRLEEGQRAQER